MTEKYRAAHLRRVEKILGGRVRQGERNQEMVGEQAIEAEGEAEAGSERG